MSDQPTYDARDWQRDLDMADDEAAAGMTAEEIAEYRADLILSAQRDNGEGV